MTTIAQKVLICGPSERDSAELRRAVASLTSIGIAVSGRDIVGDAFHVEQKPRKEPTQADLLRIEKAKAKRERKAKRLIRILEKQAKPAQADEQAAFEEWLERTCPSGDCEAVQRKWEASSEYAEWLDQHADEQAKG